ncbi:MAG: hypothetical protein IJJ85_09605 [Clostridia bacterium]|nr:hypothetical protein [Clostridia bacterium]
MIVKTDSQLKSILLKSYKTASEPIDHEDLYKKTKREIVDSFASFGVNIRLIDANLSDNRMTFFIRPEAGVRISQIKQRLNDVSLLLCIERFKMEIRTNEGVIVLTSVFSQDKDKKESSDDLLIRAIELFVENPENASISTLQRYLGLDFAKAGLLMDSLEELGIVGPSNGSRPRTVLISNKQWYSIRSCVNQNEK